MNQENRPLGSNEDNDRSLEEILWTLENSGGQFSLILVKCNYTNLRSRMARELRDRYSGKIREIFLEPSDTKLYSKIRQELGEDKPDALTVFGLESVGDIDRLLVAMNSVREEFRKNCRFPLVLWANNAIARKLIRLAPDFESWMTHAEFAIAPTDLAALVSEKAALFFNDIRATSADPEPRAKHLEEDLSAEILGYLPDASPLQPPIEKANLYALLGFAKESDNQLDAAIADYQRSLALWQEIGDRQRQAKILSHLTECCYRQARAREDSESDRQLIRDYLQQCLRVLAEANRSDLAIDYLGKLGKILRYLQDWPQLETLARQALDRHRSENQTLEVARDYGFLAEVALARQDWSEAKRLAESSLSVLETIDLLHNYGESPQPPLERGAKRIYARSLISSGDGRSIGSDRNRQNQIPLSANALPLRVRCLFVIAEAEKGLGEVKAAIANLEAAKAIGNPDEDLELYLQILQDLHDLYFKDKQYLEAYQVKQQRRSLEQQYGLRAFVGAGYLRASKTADSARASRLPRRIAPEITASGRDKDVERLLERLGRPDYKIIVIYGFSGVGKSSLLNAGLIPAIQQKIFETKEGLPVAMRVYTQWVQELGKQLSLALAQKNIPVAAPLDSQEAIIEQLQQIQERNLLVVLIFDQFEEFFFAQETKDRRNPLFELLGECRKLDGVKVIFSLKKSYIHNLLGRPGMEDINRDILNKNILYKIGNFTAADAQAIVDRLTQRANFKLEPELTQALVQDLAGKYEKVRPIELQIVGAQLQEDRITTLADYRERGSKPALVQRYLAEVVTDCGEENEQVAELTLFLLTDEQDSRPLKTQAELAGDLEALGAAVERLDLVLRILVASGLVFQLSELSGDRYQLAHDYLADLIRRQQEPKIQELIAQLERERQQRRKLEASIEDARQELKRVTQTTNRLKKIGAAVLFAALATVGIVGTFSSIRLNQAEKAWQEATLAVGAWQKFEFEELEALLVAMRAGKRLQIIVNDGLASVDYLNSSIIYSLQQILYNIWEQNQLPVSERWVNDVSFSPDGQYVVIASGESTIQVWDRARHRVREFETDHTAVVKSVSFSPDGKYIATASEDETAKIWDREGDKVLELKHDYFVNRVSFSSDGKYIATASADKTAKIWDREGNLLQILEHPGYVHSVSFSPNSKYFATASGDGTARLWTPAGNLVRQYPVGEAVYDVSFSPDGQYIATGSDGSEEGTAILWTIEGNVEREFPGRKGWVNRVNFSPDGKYIVTTGSWGGTARLWDIKENRLVREFTPTRRSWAKNAVFSPDGEYLATVLGDGLVRLWGIKRNLVQKIEHSSSVESVSVSPDGKYLATTSEEDIFIWDRNGKQVQKISGHQDFVNQVSFSPDGKYIATASFDRTVRIWDRNGKLFRILEPGDIVPSIDFSPSGQHLAIGSAGGTVRVWDIQKNELQEFTAGLAVVNSIKFSPKGEYIATASQDGTARLWDRVGNLIREFREHKVQLNSISFSSDGEYIVTGSSDFTALLWDIKTGKPIQEFIGHRGSVNTVSFSPDGQYIATASQDGTARLWDRKGNLLQEFTGHNDPVSSLSFSPDGKYIATGSDDGTARVWPVESLDELLARGCNWLRDYLQTNPNVSEEDKRLCEN